MIDGERLVKLQKGILAIVAVGTCTLAGMYGDIGGFLLATFVSEVLYLEMFEKY